MTWSPYYGNSTPDPRGILSLTSEEPWVSSSEFRGASLASPGLLQPLLSSLVELVRGAF